MKFNKKFSLISNLPIYKNKHFLVVLGIILYGIFHVCSIRMFGIPVDDYAQYEIGKMNCKAYQSLNSRKIEPQFRYYGSIYEVFAVTLERNFYPKMVIDEQKIMFHFWLSLFFIISLWYLYKTIFTITNNQWLSIMALFIIALYPRIFADSHYNTKDSFVMVLLIFANYHFVNILFFKNKFSVFYLAFFLALACTTRISILVIVCIYFCFLLFWFFKSKNYLKPIIFVLVFCLVYYAAFPAIWHNPLIELQTMMHRMQHFPWPNYNIFNGVKTYASNTPAMYIPIWLGVTIPVLFLLLAGIGIAHSIVSFFQKKRNFFLLQTAIIIVYFSIIIFSKPNLYDSWRHFQFLFIPMLFCIIYSLQLLLNYIKNNIIYLLIPIYSILNLYWCWPAPYTYFNEYYYCFCHRGSFDLDYWNCSMHQCLQQVSEISNKKAKVYAFSNYDLVLNSLMFPPEKKYFIIPSDEKYADFKIRTIRYSHHLPDSFKILYSLCPQKDTIAIVYE